jgi:DNA-directed RNA polymerase specialized sigma24 family protein
MNYCDESEFLDIVDRIANKLSRKFLFGYHTVDDMRQQCYLEALKGLENYDHSRPLENFLWIHIRNRLFNYKRDNYTRPDRINESKKDLVSPAKEHPVPIEDRGQSPFTSLYNKDLIDKVDREISITNRDLWIKMKNNIKIPKLKRDRVLEEIRFILGTDGGENVGG